MIKGVVLAVLTVLILGGALGSFYTVDEGERGVVLHNGRVSGVSDPGLHFKTPVVEDVVTIEVRQQNMRFEKVAAYSKDQQIAELVISVNFQPVIADVTRIYSEFGSVDAMAQRVLAPVVNEEVKTIFGGYTAASAIQDRGKLNADIEAALREGLSGAPLQVVSFQLENIDWSDSYEQAVEARATAEAGVATQRQQLEKEKVSAQIAVTQAQAQADSSLAQQKAVAEATLIQARADADGTRLRGEASADAIRARSAALASSPNLVELTKAERWNGVLPQTMIPGGATPMISVGGAQ